MSLLKKFSCLLFFILLIGCETPRENITLYLIGDSTMSNKPPHKDNETGWGQVLNEYFSEQVTVNNHAVNGRSTKSFISEGRWQAILDSIQEGDYVIIQFGHNDQKFKDPKRYTNPATGYRANLIRFITETREKGAHPILITSIVRRNFNEYGTLMDTHGLYPMVMREVSRELNVPLIDLQLLTEEMVLSEGEENSARLYLWRSPSEKSPEGEQDNTHLNKEGANKVAELFVHELDRQQIPLHKYLQKEN